MLSQRFSISVSAHMSSSSLDYSIFEGLVLFEESLNHVPCIMLCLSLKFIKSINISL